MGIIWYFEVISFYYGGEWSTVTDVINMLQVLCGRVVIINIINIDHTSVQGVWVFLTFVCKKNVLQVILRKRDRLYSAVLQRSRSKSSKISDLASYFKRKIFQTKNILDATTLQPESASNLNKDRKKVISLRTEEV